jgi:hypothetical protein
MDTLMVLARSSSWHPVVHETSGKHLLLLG